MKRRARFDIATSLARVAPIVFGAFAAFAAISAFDARDANACGVSGVGGQAGIACSLEEHEKEDSWKTWRTTAAYTFTSTALDFTGDRHADVERHAVAASLAIPFRKWLTFEGGLGVLPYGTIAVDGTTYKLNPAFLGALSATFNLLDEAPKRPFVLATVTIATLLGSTSAPSTSNQDFDAFDLRGAVLVGKHIMDTWSAYVVGRAFGGPVYWHLEDQAVNGTDVYHYQAGLGTTLSLGAASLFVEGVPLGERAITVGFGAAL